MNIDVCFFGPIWLLRLTPLLLTIGSVTDGWLVPSCPHPILYTIDIYNIFSSSYKQKYVKKNLYFKLYPAHFYSPEYLFAVSFILNNYLVQRYLFKTQTGQKCLPKLKQKKSLDMAIRIWNGNSIVWLKENQGKNLFGLVLFYNTCN
jgi:hypothetical protein